MNSVDFSKIKSVFFIGIGGIGISALAEMALSLGKEVAGVNDEESPKTLDPLKAKGAKIYYLSDSNILPPADFYIYSDAWIYRGPEILAHARGSGKPVLSYFEALGIIASSYKVIAVAGTHGKTTTTAMIAEILLDAGLDPTVVVGSYVKRLGSNFRKGASQWFVVEADEYNRHFLNFHPYLTVVTNIEADHLDYYKNLQDIQEAFKQLAHQSDRVIDSYETFIAKVPKLAVPGIHNRRNAAAALAAAEALGISEEVAVKSLAQFSGTWRRLERRGESKEGIIVYDDYAHHPTEIRASLEALRELYPTQRLVVVFQPHLYSRTKALFDEFAKSFGGSSTVFILPIYFAREDPDTTVSSDKLALAVTKNGQIAVAFPDFGGAEQAVLDLKLQKGDVLVTMGAGEAYKVANELFPNLST